MRRVRLAGWGIGAGAIGLLTLLSAPGAGPFPAGLAALAQSLASSGLVAGLWMLGALGLGRWARPLWRAEADHQGDGAPVRFGGTLEGAWTIQLAAGVALMLCLAHGLGALGALGSSAPGSGTIGPRLGQIIAWAPVAVGLTLLVHQLRAPVHRPETWSRLPAWALLGAPSLGVLVVAACAPPGTRWVSEANQFDTLSYHLQLPKEWLERGVVAPLDHAVYSFLPSFVESAFTQLGAMHGAVPGAPVSGGGAAVIGAQLLHALMTLATACVVARFAGHELRRAGVVGTAVAGGAALAGALVLVTPWSIVVGSCAYNEMAACLCLGGAAVAAGDPRAGARSRGILVGALLGAALGAKPTAAMMCAPGVLLLLGARTPLRCWPALALWMFVAGTTVSVPWLVRNALHGGNPVFPSLASWFGPAHWSTLELERWALGHTPDRPLLDRLGLLGAARGLGHAQWSLTPWIGGGAALVALIRQRTRRAALLACAWAGLTIVAWLVVGHQQSRFLIPLVLPLGVLVGLAWGALAAWSGPRAHVGRIALAGLVLVTGAQSVGLFLADPRGHANLGLVAGVEALTGELTARSWGAMSDAERRVALESLPPMAATSLILGPRVARGERPLVYLLGDSTPFYMTVPALWHTTWDRSPLGAALRASGGDLSAAAAALRARGVTHLLVNFSELDRLSRERWYDPDVNPAIAERLVREHARPIMEWGITGRWASVLAELDPRVPGPGPSGP